MNGNERRVSWSVWLEATRPKTLPAAIVPVLVGLAVAARSGPIDLTVGAATMVAALLIQIGTNLANDYYDFLRGADTSDRLGPRRVTQAGLVTPRAVRRAALGTLAVAAALGAYLVAVGGIPILAIGVLSLVCAIAYTAGPWPIAYLGLGEVFVFLFFGVLAVTGTVWLQTHEANVLALAASVPVGALATAILVVNNLRDVETDRRAGKHTLAVRIGPAATRSTYVALVAGSFAFLAVLALPEGPWLLLPAAAVPLAVREIRAVLRNSGSALNDSLAGTARLHLVANTLLAVSLLP